MKKIILSAITVWLLWLGVWILIIRFDKYDWADPPVVDCDTDAEGVAALLMWLVWITATFLIAWFYLAKETFGANFASFALSMALLISIGSVSKYVALQEYNEVISQQCDMDSSNAQRSQTSLPLNQSGAR